MAITDLNDPALIEMWTMANTNVGVTTLYGEKGVYNASISGAISVDGVMGDAIYISEGRADFGTAIIPATGDWAICGYIIFPEIPEIEKNIFGQYELGHSGRLLGRISAQNYEVGSLSLFIGGISVGSRLVTIGKQHFFMMYRRGGIIGVAVDNLEWEEAAVSASLSIYQGRTYFFDEDSLTDQDITCVAERWRMLNRVPTEEEYFKLMAEARPYTIRGVIDVDAIPHVGKVYAVDGSTGSLIASTTTNSSGEYEFFITKEDDILVIPEPPDGYKAKIAGPITPALRTFE
ncbi:hypothetical protein Q4508_12605 [Amphritea sp. 2_MG-2023]|uniref:hypothetical protein n=1 Tax=Amphritea TaxID=515417 RepID=UPI001C076B69|nr:MULTISPECIES: hypothetical protein [Amphritea]MBU2967055.1 hypothetical protein [Amphritea atlantica]MDO6419392.1 hypothetical protein [Amphritea sp. 2_MG-2023]